MRWLIFNSCLLNEPFCVTASIFRARDSQTSLATLMNGQDLTFLQSLDFDKDSMTIEIFDGVTLLNR